jgi:hypothetical protein
MAPPHLARRTECVVRPSDWAKRKRTTSVGRRPPDLNLVFVELKYAAADLQHILPSVARLIDLAADTLALCLEGEVAARGHWKGQCSRAEADTPREGLSRENDDASADSYLSERPLAS